MRAYFVNNMYLSSIQNGIQPAHVIHEMFRKYDGVICGDNLEKRLQLYDWADNHKTIIVLNGGMTEHLEKFLQLVENSQFTFATFYEPGIGNALTSIGIIVPEYFYTATEEELLSNENVDLITKTLIMTMRTFSLAK